MGLFSLSYTAIYRQGEDNLYRKMKIFLILGYIFRCSLSFTVLSHTVSNIDFQMKIWHLCNKNICKNSYLQKHWFSCQFSVCQKIFQNFTAFFQSCFITCINHKNDSMHLEVIINSMQMNFAVQISVIRKLSKTVHTL